MTQERFSGIKFAWRHKGVLGTAALGLTVAIAAANHKDTSPGGHDATPGTHHASASTSHAARPTLNAADGKFNQAHSNGVVNCHLDLSRQAGGGLAVNATLNPAVRGAWISYDVSSQRGTFEGFAAGKDATVPNTGGIMDGTAAYIQVAEHYAYGNHMLAAECGGGIPK